MINENEQAKKWYEESYTKEGLAAQRRYPNEEFCRFMGRNFFKIPFNERSHFKILELGCGSCANLWMVGKEKFDAYGIDFSAEAIRLGEQMLDSYALTESRPKLSVQDMTQLSFSDGIFDAVVDVFSTFVLETNGFEKCLDEVYRVLKRGGKFFAYTPSKNSQAFINYAPAEKIDESTLNGIYRKDSPYVGNEYPFRFISEKDLEHFCGDRFEISYLEKVGRTYSREKEYFEFLVFELIKK